MGKEYEISRRSALKIMGVGGGALFAYMSGRLILDQYKLERVANSRIFMESAVKATDMARPEGPIPELLLLPNDLLKNSGVYISLKEDVVNSSGSLTLTTLIKEQNIAICLTAGHCVDSIKDSDLIDIQQPQINMRVSEIIYPNFISLRDSKKDLGIIAFNNDPIFGFDKISNTRFNLSWIPNPEEKLFSLSFPDIAEKHNRMFPSIFNLSEEIYIKDSDGRQCYLADTVVGGGSSGAAVATENGDIIGIITEMDSKNRKAVITPIGNEYDTLVQKAVNIMDQKQK